MFFNNYIKSNYLWKCSYFMYNQFICSRAFTKNFKLAMCFCFSNTFGFLVNIEYAKVLKQLCWEIVIYLRH